MPRSKWKIPYTCKYLSSNLITYYKLVETAFSKDPHKKSINYGKSSKFLPILTDNRMLPISISMVGLLIHVHNGHRYIPVKITSDMIGCKLGEFVPTRRILVHKKTKKK